MSRALCFSPEVFLFLICKLCFSYLAASISGIYRTSWKLPRRCVCSWGHFQVIEQTSASLGKIVSRFVGSLQRSCVFHANPEEKWSRPGCYRSEIWLNRYLKSDVCCTERSRWPTTGLDADEVNYQAVNLSEWNSLPQLWKCDGGGLCAEPARRNRCVTQWANAESAKSSSNSGKAEKRKTKTMF